jgi:hypothetical protein
MAGLSLKVLSETGSSNLLLERTFSGGLFVFLEMLMGDSVTGDSLYPE